LFDATGDLAAHGFHGPSTKILVDEAGGHIQFMLRDIHPQHTVAHQSRLGYNYSQ
jgi:hypothetical protein